VPSKSSSLDHILCSDKDLFTSRERDFNFVTVAGSFFKKLSFYF